MVTAAMAAALSKAGTYDNGAGLLLAAREAAPVTVALA
jgi:hypothetical protein